MQQRFRFRPESSKILVPDSQASTARTVDMFSPNHRRLELIVKRESLQFSSHGKPRQSSYNQNTQAQTSNNPQTLYTMNLISQQIQNEDQQSYYQSDQKLARLNALQNNHEEISNKLKQIIKENERLQNEVNILSEENRKIAQDKVSLNIKKLIDELEMKINSLIGENERLTGLLTGTNTLDEYRTEYENTRKEIDEYKMENSQLTQTFNVRAQIEQSLKQEIQDLQIQIDLQKAY